MHYMLSAMSDEENLDELEDNFLAGTTDGQDGPTDVAACAASLFEWKTLEPKNFDKIKLQQEMRKHDSNNFWAKHKQDWLYKTGLTGTNVMDVYFALYRLKSDFNNKIE